MNIENVCKEWFFISCLKPLQWYQKDAWVVSFLSTGNTMMCYLDLPCENQDNFHCLKSIKINLLQHGLHEPCFFREHPPTQWGSLGTAVWLPSPSRDLFRSCRTLPPPPETLQGPQGHLCWGTQSTPSLLFLSPQVSKSILSHFFSHCLPPLILLLQPPSATKTLTPALNTIIYFPSTWGQNCLKTYFTPFSLDYEKLISHKFI